MGALSRGSGRDKSDSRRPKGAVAVLIRGLVMTLAALVLLSAAPALADDGTPPADTWVKVADGGLGDLTPGAPRRDFAADVAIHRGYVYVAGGTRSNATHLFRAPLLADRSWENVTPDWGTASIADIEVFGEDLYVATSIGIWRRSANDVWQILSSQSFLALGVWQTASGSRLCAVVAPLDVLCASQPPLWQNLPDHPLASQSDLGAIVLRHFMGRLYVGVSGTTASSPRRCSLYRTDGTSWHTVTDDCFGGENLPWLGGLQEFGGWLYVATGGHFGRPLIMRTQPAGNEDLLEDVTPYNLYRGYSGQFEGTTPGRYGSIAATSSRLLVGTRTVRLNAGIADVVVRDTTGAWRHSNRSGFDGTNDTTVALAAEGNYAYAATINTEAGGFQVWRKQSVLQLTLDTVDAASRRLLLSGLIRPIIKQLPPLCASKQFCPFPPPCPPQLCPVVALVVRDLQFIGVGAPPGDVGERDIGT